MHETGGDTIRRPFLKGIPIKKQLVPLLILSGLLVAACGAVGQGIQVPQSPLLAAVERKSGLIAYLGPDGNVYTIDQGGGKLNMVTEDANLSEAGTQRFYDYPTWSLEDNKLAFVGFDVEDNLISNSSIFATGKKAERAQEIYSSNANVPFYLYWSPDGDWVSFLSSVPGTTTMAMQIAPAEGGETSLVDTGRPYYWAWSPND